MTDEHFAPPPPDQSRPHLPIVPPSYDPKAVYVNGQAIGLITSLIEGLRSDLRASEANLRQDIKDRFDHHEASHRQIQRTADAVHETLAGRVKDLETAHDQDEDTADIKKAYRDGQMMFFRSSWTLIDKNKTVILAIIGAMFGSAFVSSFINYLLGGSK